MKYRKAIGNRQFTKDPERPERPRIAEALDACARASASEHGGASLKDIGIFIETTTYGK